jgi:hypothetical protein
MFTNLAYRYQSPCPRRRVSVQASGAKQYFVAEHSRCIHLHYTIEHENLDFILLYLLRTEIVRDLHLNALRKTLRKDLSAT